MSSMVCLKGRLTRDADVKFLNSGQSVAGISLAINEGYKGASGWVEKAVFINCKAWGKKAVFCQELKKGDIVFITGKLDFEQWEKDGKKNSRVTVLVDTIETGMSIKGENISGEMPPDLNGQFDNQDDIPF